MSIIETISLLKESISSIYDGMDKSIFYNSSPREIFNFLSLDIFRKDQVSFNEKIDSLDQESLNVLRQEVINILKQSKPKSHFGFDYNDFGNSKRRMDLSLELLKKSIKNEAEPKICELGTCHGGWTSLWFLHNNVINPQNYFGCDIIPDYCRLLKIFGMNITPINLAKEDFTSILPKQNDLVIVTEVIEHMPNENVGLHLLKYACELLSDEGDMIISYPRIVRDISDDPIGHQYQPNLKNINKTLESKFLKIEMNFDGGREYHHCIGYKKNHNSI